MVRFNVRPSLVVDESNAVKAACHVSFNHGANEVDIRLSDSMLKNGGSNVDGLVVTLRNGQGLDLEYDVARKAPTLRMRSSVLLCKRVVDVRYQHALKTNATRVNLSHQVDENNVAKLELNTKGWDNPSHRNLIARWSYRQGDFTVEPAFDLGLETAALTARYNADLENQVCFHVDSGTSVGELAWRHRGGWAGDGDVRVVAKTSLDRTSWTRPSLLVEKTWTVDK